MKLSTLTLLSLPVIASAFAPSTLFGAATSSTSFLVAVVTGPNGEAASSKEEDLELVVQLLMGDEDGAAPPPPAEEKKQAQKPKKEKKPKKTPPPAIPEEMDISKLDIRVGTILEAWEHTEADKLFCETIDIGESEPRQIASGLRAYYKAEDLVGRRVCVLANLKSRKLVGFSSHGMVLCASNQDGSEVVFVDPPSDAAIGERVLCSGFDGEAASENQVIKKKILDKVFPDLMTDKDGVAMYKGIPLTAGTGSCVAQGGLADAQVS